MSRKKKESPLITRGYKEVIEVMKKKAKFIRHCNSCHYFYKSKGDEEELCQNDSVLEYDIIVDGTTIFCHYWKPTEDLVEEENDTKENDYLARFKRR